MESFEYHSLNDDSPSGEYNIHDGTFILCRKGALEFHVDSINMLMDYMYNIEPTPNPYRPSTFIKRSQITFSNIDYNFGQNTKTMPLDENTPSIITDGMLLCNKILNSLGYEDQKLNGAHVSMYPDGTSGISPHADDEPVIDQSVPIVSLSFGVSRRFSIYRNQTDEERSIQLLKSKAKVPPACKPVKLCSTILNHGDICIMVNMQKCLLHGIDKEPKITGSRLNITYRKFMYV